MLRKAISLVQKEIDKKWWASIFRFVRRQVEASLKTTSENHRKKLEKLSERQDKPLGGRNERSVKVLDNIELPEWVYEVLSMGPKHPIRDKFKDRNGLCPCCSRKVTYRSKGVECESCRNWYHLKCGKIFDDVYASITEIVWYCESCCQANNKEKDTPQLKLILRYVDDIVRTVRVEPSCLLDAANSLHPILQFTLEKTNSEGNLPFLDLNINVSQGRRVTCSWYQKPNTEL